MLSIAIAAWAAVTARLPPVPPFALPCHLILDETGERDLTGHMDTAERLSRLTLKDVSSDGTVPVSYCRPSTVSSQLAARSPIHPAQPGGAEQPRSALGVVQQHPFGLAQSTILASTRTTWLSILAAGRLAVPSDPVLFAGPD